MRGDVGGRSQQHGIAATGPGLGRHKRIGQEGQGHSGKQSPTGSVYERPHAVLCSMTAALDPKIGIKTNSSKGRNRLQGESRSFDGSRPMFVPPEGFFRPALAVRPY
jgi:hypothetical protein